MHSQGRSAVHTAHYTILQGYKHDHSIQHFSHQAPIHFGKILIIVGIKLAHDVVHIVDLVAVWLLGVFVADWPAVELESLVCGVLGASSGSGSWNGSSDAGFSSLELASGPGWPSGSSLDRGSPGRLSMYSRTSWLAGGPGPLACLILPFADLC